MSRPPAIALALALLAAPLLAQQGIAPSADQVDPLLIGAEIPDVTVRTLEGEPARLPELLRGQKSLLIFYRGGW